MTTVILTACGEPRSVREGRAIYKAYFQKYLKDPESFKVYSEKYEVREGGQTVKWTLDYGAKNGWGSMDRETVEFETIYDLIYINGHCYNKRDLK